MAIPDVGVALAAPTPQMPAPAGNKSKAIAHEGRQSFASIVSDLSDDSRPSAASATGDATRPASSAESEASSERPVQNGRAQSKAGANKSARAATQGESSSNVATASADQQRRTSSAVETDAKGVAGRRSEAGAEGDTDPQIQGTAGGPVDVPLPIPIAVPGIIATASGEEVPQPGDAERGVAGQLSEDGTDGHAVNPDGVGPLAFLRTRGLKGEFPSKDTGDAGRSGPGGGADIAVDSQEAVDPTASDGSSSGVSDETETTASIAARQTARPSRALTGLAPVRRVASTEAVLIARTSIRDALARSVSADASQADAAQTARSAESVTGAAQIDAVASRAGDAAGAAATSESGKPAVASGVMSDVAGRIVPQTSESVATTSAQVADASSSAQANVATVAVDPTRATGVEVDGTPAGANRRGVATQGSSTSTTATVATQIRSPRVQGAGSDTPSAAAQSAQAQQAGESAHDDAGGSDDQAASIVTTLNPSSTTADRGLAPLAAQRAQARYARVSADGQMQAVESAVTTANATSSVGAVSAGIPGTAVADTPQIATPQTLTTPIVPRSLAPRSLDARQGRALSSAGIGASASSAASAHIAVNAATASAITAAQDARFGESATSKDDGADQSGRASHRSHSAADATVDPLSFNSPVRQFADAGAIGTSTLSTSRSGRDLNATAPAPVAQRLTGTSAIAIAAFQAVAAAALTTPETVSSSGSSASTRVMDLELPSQIVQLVRLRSDNGDGQVHMRLNPDYLGDVSVDVRMNGASVVASVHASSAEVRDWLSANEMQLRQTLADQGLHLQELVVADDEPSQRESSGQRHQPSDEQPQERRARRPRETATFEVLL